MGLGDWMGCFMNRAMASSNVAGMEQEQKGVGSNFLPSTSTRGSRASSLVAAAANATKHHGSQLPRRPPCLASESSNRLIRGAI